MFKIIPAVICISCFISCALDREQQEIIVNKDSVVRPVTESCGTVDFVETKTEVINNTFVEHVLDMDLSRHYLDSLYRNVPKINKLVDNAYTAGVRDTITTYKAYCDSVSYIAARTNTFIIYADFYSNRIRLFNNRIAIGQDKDDFLKVLRLKDASSDCIQVTNSEGTNQLTFAFKENKLVRIVYENLHLE